MPHKNGQLQKFDIVLANPPYSIKQWNRDAFASDFYGRNIWGTPPQGRADYAFLQHIVSSLDPKTGRCAILFPHGVLFRKEEKAMREQMVKSDLIECVIGLGPNLFFNSPMEACIIICRTRKEPAREKSILFINAIKEVTRKNAESYLEEEHIRKIVHAYNKAENISSFCKLASCKEIENKNYDLTISRYVHPEDNLNVDTDSIDSATCIKIWQDAHRTTNESIEGLIALLK